MSGLITEGDGTMQARIFQPARSAMTSGTANTRKWVLEYVPAEPRRIDPLMGWTGSGDMAGQVQLRFETREAAIDYARRNGLAYTVEESGKRRANIRPHGYGGNFAHDRRGAWTH
jgi:NADH dehydrogenase